MQLNLKLPITKTCNQFGNEPSFCYLSAPWIFALREDT